MCVGVGGAELCLDLLSVFGLSSPTLLLYAPSVLSCGLCVGLD